MVSTPAAGEARTGRVLAGPPVPQWLKRLSGETLVELLDLGVARSGDDVAIVMRDGDSAMHWTYREIAESSRRIATTLRLHGVRPGARILTLAPNDPWLVAAYFAIWRLGAAVVPLDLRMAPDVAARIGRAVDATLMLVGPSVDQAQIEAIGVRHLRVARDTLDPPAEPASASSTRATSDSRSAGSTPPAAARSDEAARTDEATGPAPDTLAEILFTSGTTTDPKGVMITHGQMVHNTRAVGLTSRPITRQHALAVIPLSHAYGQMILCVGILTGSQITFVSAPTPTRILDALRQDRITTITVVPQFLEILLARIEGEAGRRGSLDRLRRGAPPCRAAARLGGHGGDRRAGVRRNRMRRHRRP